MGVASPHHWYGSDTHFLTCISKTSLTMCSPTCKKNPVPRCVDLKHMFHCPRHPEAYCLDKEGKTCVMCKEAEKRFKRSQLKDQRVAREAQVAAALAARADTLAAGKVRWDTKLPSMNKLAKTESKRAQQASNSRKAQIKENSKAEKACKGARGAKLAKFVAIPNLKDDASSKEQQRSQGRPKLRIQRER